MRLIFQLGSLALINIALTFLYQWYALTSIGPGIETDALFAGMTVPLMVVGVVVGSLMHVLVPLLSGEDDEVLRRNSWTFLWVIIAVFLMLTAILFVSATWWVPLAVPGFSQAGKLLTIHLTQIQLIGVVFSAANSVQWAAYHARQHFIWAEVAPVLAGALALILLFFLLPIYGIFAAAWISVIRSVLQTLLLLPGMGKPAKPNLRGINIAMAWSRIRPLLIGSIYYKTEPLIDRYLLSSAVSGSLSLYALAQQIYGAANQIIAKSISSPTVPLLSRLYKSGDQKEFHSVYQGKLILVGLICCIAYVNIAILGEWALKITMSYGRFTVSDTQTLYWLLIWLGGMFFGGALGQLASSSFYAEGKTKAPVYISIMTYTLYIPCKIVVYGFYSFKGLALLTSVYYLTDFILMYFYRNYRVKIRNWLLWTRRIV